MLEKNKNRETNEDRDTHVQLEPRRSCAEGCQQSHQRCCCSREDRLDHSESIAENQPCYNENSIT